MWSDTCAVVLVNSETVTPNRTIDSIELMLLYSVTQCKLHCHFNHAPIAVIIQSRHVGFVLEEVVVRSTWMEWCAEGGGSHTYCAVTTGRWDSRPVIVPMTMISAWSAVSQKIFIFDLL